MCCRRELFQQLNARTIRVALLLGNYLCTNTTQKGVLPLPITGLIDECLGVFLTVSAAQEILSYPGNIKTLLEFMLRVLPVSGDNFLPVFRCVHGFCVGELFLSPSDEALLLEQMKLNVGLEEGGGGGEGEGEGSSEKSEGGGDTQAEEEKGNDTLTPTLIVDALC